jgi:MYXO-CTERM domain-containing protein
VMGWRTGHNSNLASGREKDPAMKTVAIAVVGTASLVASADAGFLGFVAFAKQSAANQIMVDIFCAVQNSSDKFLNVYNLNGTTTAAGGFYQQAGLATKTWKPDAANFNSTRDSIDSFMTAGTYSGGAYGGVYYASTNTNGDPNFTGTSWNGTPVSAAATTIPALAGWYTGDPTSVDNQAESFSTMPINYMRFDSVATAASGSTGATVGSAGATRGIWCSHIVVAGTLNANLMSSLISWNGAASIKDGVSGATSQGQSSYFIPAPGAIAMLGLAGFASRRRRA